eukprot:Tbor_TRINITY_DN5176_c5_g7::TRINITY_DN5176_c5_g7_i1::g.25896::m.25896
MSEETVELHHVMNTMEERVADGDGNCLDHTLHTTIKDIFINAEKKYNGTTKPIAITVANKLKEAINNNNNNINDIINNNRNFKNIKINSINNNNNKHEMKLTDEELVEFFHSIFCANLGTHEMILQLRNNNNNNNKPGTIP